MDEYLMTPAARAVFDTARYAKADLARGTRLFLGINMFEPGQAQPAHTHADADKFYLVLTGKARIAIADGEVLARAGDLVWCPAGVPHGVAEALERSVLLVGMSPPPG